MWVLVHHTIRSGVWCGRVQGAIHSKKSVVGMYSTISVVKLTVDINVIMEHYIPCIY